MCVWVGVDRRCELCSCDVAGSVSDLCDVISGQCLCKKLTTSRSCGQCVPGSSNLDPNNPYGCSQGIVTILNY